jgi:uncharacterized protein (DUF1810 family)
MHDLERFRSAQERTYETALAELTSGCKRSHWMWFIFPQLAALGRSPTAKHYGIDDLEEARDYLADPLLGPRLLACTRAVLMHPDDDAETIMGPVDALKLRSCATLFREAGGGNEFQAVLDTFYGGEPCPLTLAELEREV